MTEAEAMCEFTRTSTDTTWRCAAKGKPVEMYNGGVVYVCAYHRPWMVAMARVEAEK